jgi:KUP system potassium uptake protein
VLHKRVVVLTVATAQIPHVPDDERLSIQPSDTTCSNVRVQYGFMEDPNVPKRSSKRASEWLQLHADDVAYPPGRETIIVTRREGMASWREKLFVLIPDAQSLIICVEQAAVAALDRCSRASRRVELVRGQTPDDLY